MSSWDKAKVASKRWNITVFSTGTCYRKKLKAGGAMNDSANDGTDGGMPRAGTLNRLLATSRLFTTGR